MNRYIKSKNKYLFVKINGHKTIRENVNKLRITKYLLTCILFYPIYFKFKY